MRKDGPEKTNKDNLAENRCNEFAVRIVSLYKFLTEEKREYVMSKQILRSGTSIGANLTEAEYAQSKADFYSKIGIALKEAAETRYWLNLLYRTDYITEKQNSSMIDDLEPIIKIFIKTIKSKKDITK